MLRERSGKRSVCYQGTGSEWYRKVACGDGTLWIRMRGKKAFCTLQVVLSSGGGTRIHLLEKTLLLSFDWSLVITGLRVESETKILRRKFICLLVPGHKRLFWFSCITLTVRRHLHAKWAENRKWIRVADSWLQALLSTNICIPFAWTFRIGRDNLLLIYYALTLTGR